MLSLKQFSCLNQTRRAIVRGPSRQLNFLLFRRHATSCARRENCLRKLELKKINVCNESLRSFRKKKITRSVEFLWRPGNHLTHNGISQHSWIHFLVPYVLETCIIIISVEDKSKNLWYNDDGRGKGFLNIDGCRAEFLKKWKTISRTLYK